LAFPELNQIVFDISTGPVGRDIHPRSEVARCPRITFAGCVPMDGIIKDSME